MVLIKGFDAGFIRDSPSADPLGNAALFIDTRALYTQDTSSATATKITEMGWWCDNATEESNFEVGLYTENGNAPDTRLNVETTNAKGTTAGWKSVVGLNWNISASTTYWLAVQLDNTATQTDANFTTLASSGARYDIQSSLPSSAGSVSLLTNALWGIYAVTEDPIPHFAGAGAIAFDTNSPISVTPTPPTHQENDILIAMSLSNLGAEMSTVTAGWTRISFTSLNIDVAYFWKRAPGSGTVGPTITNGGSGDTFAICYVIRGCITDATPFEDATTDAATNDVTPDTAEIDTTDVNRLVVGVCGIDDNFTWTNAPPPAGWTLKDDRTSSDGNDCRFTFISKPEASATTVSTVVIGTLSTIEDWGSLTLAFIPPLAPTGTNAQINIDDDWRAIEAAQINIGDTWKAVEGMQVNIGDTWKTIF